MKFFKNAHGLVFSYDDEDYAKNVLGLTPVEEPERKEDTAEAPEEDGIKEIGDMSMKELKELAKLVGVKGYSKMSHDALVEAIEKEGE